MRKSNFTKKEISAYLSQKMGISVRLSDKLLNEIISIFSLKIKNGNLILKNFGTFRILIKKERIGRNPKSLEIFKIKKRKSISFSAAEKLVKEINT